MSRETRLFMACSRLAERGGRQGRRMPPVSRCAVALALHCVIPLCAIALVGTHAMSWRVHP